MEHFPEFVANHLLLFVLLVSILILLLWNLFGAVLSGVVLLSPREIVRMLNDDAVIVDIRTAADFSKGHVLGARNIPADSIEEQLTELAKYREQSLVLCCNTGNESVRAGRTLKMQGFKKIYCLQGGLQAWRTANLPLTRGTSAKNNPDEEGTTDD
jgi:rhodanese-related sulfurtransferase